MSIPMTLVAFVISILSITITICVRSVAAHKEEKRTGKLRLIDCFDDDGEPAVKIQVGLPLDAINELKSGDKVTMTIERITE